VEYEYEYDDAGAVGAKVGEVNEVHVVAPLNENMSNGQAEQLLFMRSAGYVAPATQPSQDKDPIPASYSSIEHKLFILIVD